MTVDTLRHNVSRQMLFHTIVLNFILAAFDWNFVVVESVHGKTVFTGKWMILCWSSSENGIYELSVNAQCDDVYLGDIQITSSSATVRTSSSSSSFCFSKTDRPMPEPRSVATMASATLVGTM